MSGSRRRWVLAVAMVGGLATAAVLMQPPDGRQRITGERARPLILSSDQVARSFGANPDDVVASSPPVDVDALERGAQAVPFADVPLPDDRFVQSWARRDTGQVVTQAILVYNDPARAADLNRLAERLLPMAFGLSSQPATIEGAQDARAWTATGYQGMSFRRGAYVFFVGADGSDISAVYRLAQAIAAAPLPVPAPSATTGTPAPS